MYQNKPMCDYKYVRMTADEPILKRIGGNFEGQQYCGFCSVPDGNIHHLGCPVELCPKCNVFFHDGGSCPHKITLYYKSPKDRLGTYFGFPFVELPIQWPSP
jgi:hypothetical protein